MPIIYLSPSTQEWNAYVTGSGSEETNMNLLADALIPDAKSLFMVTVFFPDRMMSASTVELSEV